MPVPSTEPVVRFGEFEVDLRTGELRGSGTRSTLQEQPRRILVLLLARPGALVTRDELRQELWADDTFVDFEHSLNAAIKRLRDALGDSADAPKYIETLPRRGYRLISAVSGGADAPVPVADSTRRHRVRQAMVLTIAGGLAVAGAFAGRWIRHAPAEESWGRPDVMAPVVMWPTAERSSRISPDGQWISFLSTQAGHSRVWVRHREGTEPRELSTPAGSISSQVWSPDGKQIAYIIQRPAEQILQVVPAFFGGAPREILRLKGYARLVRWIGPDIFAEQHQQKLARIDAKTGALSELRVSDDDELRFKKGYDVAADGRTVVFSARRGGQDDLWVGNLETSRVRRLTDDPFSELYPVFARGPQADVVFYQSNRSGQLDVWRTNVVSGATAQVTVSGLEEIPEDVSSDGSLLTFRRGGTYAELWSREPSGNMVQLSDGLWDFWPSVLPSGFEFAFQRRTPTLDSGFSLRETDIFLAKRAAGRLDVSPVPIAHGFAPVLSPSGRLVAFVQASKLGPAYAELLVMDIGAHRITKVTERYAFPGTIGPPLDLVARNVVWDPRAPRLYYVEWTPEVVAQIREMDFSNDVPARRTLKIAGRSRELLNDLHLSPDARQLAYVRHATSVADVRVVDVASGVDRAIGSAASDAAGLFFLCGWLPGSVGLLAVAGAADESDSSQQLKILQINEGGPRVLAPVRHAFGQTARLAPSGQELFLTMSDDGVHNVYAFSFANHQFRRITDNGRSGVSYSAFEFLHSGSLIMVRHVDSQDVWTLTFVNAPVAQ